jgi:hypothetical protein
MIRFTGFFAIIPATLLLTLSYIVIYLNSKTESGGVRLLGKIITVLLWAGAALALIMGAYIVVTGKHPAVAVATAMCQNMSCCAGKTIK